MANKIEHWLESIGLGKYTDVFAENEITFEALPHLTEHDLRELGLPVGPRRIIAAAVAKLPHPASQRDAAPPGESSGQRTEAERRHLTVLFCDLVGSTELSTKLDPEDMRDLLRAYQDACTRVISRFDGYVAKFMGDGVYAYFGYPRAHEDDAERAIHAAIGLVAAVQQLDSKMTDLAVRVGIATGPVVVGDLLGQGASQEAAVTGETPNLAGRLQSLAAPNAIVISDTTYRLAGGTFECANRGKHALKGFAEPVQTWSVIRPRPVESRFDATRSSGITELIGRNEEVEILLRRWQRAKAGQGQVVLITGEPGIGKSRLVRVLQDGIAGEPHTRLFFQCSPYHTGSALHPVIEQLQRAAQFEAADEAPTKLRKLETVLGLAGHNDPQTAALFASLLSVPTADRYPALALSPPQLKQRTLDALIQQLVGLAERQPVLFVFEDAHWIDPTSMELLERMLARLEGLPVLAVITYRPEFTAPWGGGAQVTLLTLNRLSREDRTAMAERVAGGAQLPMEVLDQIASRTDGVPLFVEELTKTILESGLLIDAGDRYVLRGPLPPLAIPSTLHASLLARLDRLAAVKDVAQTAAAIGRQFSYSLIAAVAGIPEQDLRAALAQLVAAELVFQRGLAPDAKYLFKHALVQDAAYASLVRSRRQQLHAQIARALEEQFPDVVASEPEVLAHHFTAAGLTERAVHYWQRAGQQASDRSAYLEATKHFNTGIELLKTLPDTPARNQQELALHIALGAALIVTKGHASVEVERAYLKARELCHGMGDTSELVPILFGLWRCYVARPQLRTARELGETMLCLADNANDPALAVLAHYAVGASRYFLGELPEARQHLEDGIAQYKPDQRRAPAFRSAQDPGVACRSYSAKCLWLLGFPDQALARGQDALALAHELSHPFSVVFAQLWLAFVSQFRRDLATVHEQAEAALALATEQGFPNWAAVAMIFRGWALAMQHKSEEAMVELLQGLATFRGAMGAGVWLPFYFTMLTESFDLLGKTKDALQELDEAQAEMEKTEERWWEAEIYRLRGVLLLKHSMASHAEAETWLRRALDVARRQQAKSLELRAAISLASLWRDQDKHAEARDLLAPVYGWFTEGFTTSDLKDAKALLEKFSSGKSA